METKEHDLIFDDLEDNLEAKQHDLLFDDSDEDQEEQVEVNKHEVTLVSNAEAARKMHEDEGVDFDMILQAQQANRHLRVNQHELSDSDSSDEESAADIEVNAHNLKKGVNKPKIKGLLHFSDSDSEDEHVLQCPSTVEGALAIDERAEINDPDEEVEESIEPRAIARMPEAKLPKGLLHFDDSDNKETKPI